MIRTSEGVELTKLGKVSRSLSRQTVMVLKEGKLIVQTINLLDINTIDFIASSISM